jgi:NAD(P)-dependent dehydrogenase (short-subunit alcohol dehydrogenase family)
LFYGSSVYTGTKHALKGIAESLALELLPFNMRVNLVCPGFTESPMLDDGMQLAPSRLQCLELYYYFVNMQLWSAAAMTIYNRISNAAQYVVLHCISWRRCSNHMQ